MGTCSLTKRSRASSLRGFKIWGESGLVVQMRLSAFFNLDKERRRGSRSTIPIRQTTRWRMRWMFWVRGTVGARGVIGGRWWVFDILVVASIKIMINQKSSSCSRCFRKRRVISLQAERDGFPYIFFSQWRSRAFPLSRPWRAALNTTWIAVMGPNQM